MDRLLSAPNLIRSSNMLSIWPTYSNIILGSGVFIMAVFASLKLGNEFYRLIWEAGPLGAIDLIHRYEEVNYWFIGKPVYEEFITYAVYPPASYIILWPCLGWLSLTHARFLWAITSLAVMLWFVFLIVKESKAERPLERLFVCLMFLSMNATGVTVGNGQLILHLLPMLLTGLLFLKKRRRRWPQDLFSSGLIVLSLVKPSVSVPFLWLALLIPKSIRPLTIVVTLYLLLTIISASFQGPTLITVLYEWLKSTTFMVELGYANVISWLTAIGLENWALSASLIVFLALGIWTYFYRNVDFWIPLGITAIVARFWTYHEFYDNILIILPMVALFRLAKTSSFSPPINLILAILLATNIFANIIPARVYFFWPHPWPSLFAGFHTILWFIMMIFLLVIASIKDKQKNVNIFV